MFFGVISCFSIFLLFFLLLQILKSSIDLISWVPVDFVRDVSYGSGPVAVSQTFYTLILKNLLSVLLQETAKKEGLFCCFCCLCFQTLKKCLISWKWKGSGTWTSSPNWYIEWASSGFHYLGWTKQRECVTV